MSQNKQNASEQENEVFAQMKLNMVQAHIKYISFYLYVHQVNNYALKDTKTKEHLFDLLRVYGLKSLIDDCGAVFDSGYFVPSSFTNMKSALDILIKKLRPMLIPLIESVAQPDCLLPSNIGNSYGDIYEQQLEWAQNSSLNKADKDGVPDTFEKYIKPFLHEDVSVVKAKL